MAHKLSPILVKCCLGTFSFLTQIRRNNANPRIAVKNERKIKKSEPKLANGDVCVLTYDTYEKTQFSYKFYNED